jgi:hypothetical protein
MKVQAGIAVMIIGVIIALTGCAGSKVFLMDVKYLPEKKAAPTGMVVGICQFQDLREEQDKDLIGVRHHGEKHVDLLKLEGVSLSDAVTQAVKDYFTDNGVQVTDCRNWDGSPEGLDRLPGDLNLVVGGKIDSFRVEAKSGITITNIAYHLKLRALIGKIKERKVAIRTVESTPTDKTMGFDPEKVKKKLHGTVTEALNTLLADCLVCD